MAHQCEVPGRSSDEGTDQGTNQTGSDGVRTDEVSERSDHVDQYLSSADLDPSKEYKITGQALNIRYNHGVREFNDNQQKHQSAPKGGFLYEYASGFWNGYVAAITSVRNEVRRAVLDRKVQ
jgi:hypothetical protein